MNNANETEGQLFELTERIKKMSEANERQAVLLERLYKLLAHSMESVQTKDGKPGYSFRTRVIDFRMSLNSALEVALKWSIALFVWGIIIGCVVGFLLSVLNGR